MSDTPRWPRVCPGCGHAVIVEDLSVNTQDEHEFIYGLFKCPDCATYGDAIDFPEAPVSVASDATVSRRAH